MREPAGHHAGPHGVRSRPPAAPRRGGRSCRRAARPAGRPGRHPRRLSRRPPALPRNQATPAGARPRRAAQRVTDGDQTPTRPGRRGLPPPVAQHEVHDHRGRFVGRVDLAYPRWRIAIEYEGDHHRERTQFRRDVARLNDLRACGWLVLRFTADDVLRHPERIIALVHQAVAERGRPTRSGGQPC
ncbi:DUF559 domain-containing protein [Polymorphospora sp. NPDC051019]|uniref:endonuclease domain-containing protein n=1 Tax=Polymorphospora sp. NPDC051019 TaxID=3155725 RepID=UPI003424C164